MASESAAAAATQHPFLSPTSQFLMRNGQDVGLSNDFVHKVAHIIQPKYKTIVTSCDHLKSLPVHFGEEQSIIINTASVALGQRVGHFACLVVIPQLAQVRFYDSLNIALSDPNIKKYLEKVLKEHPDFEFQSSPFVTQNSSSSLCGVYSLSALASVTEAGGQLSMQQFYDKFSRTDLRKNDNICLQYLLDFIVQMKN